MEGAGDSRGPMALVCLGGLPWTRAWKRNQSLAYRLSRMEPFDRLVFVNPEEIWLRDDRIGARESLPAKIRRLHAAGPSKPRDGVHEIHMVHFVPMKSLLRFGVKLERKVFLDRIRAACAGLPYVLLNNHPCFFDREALVSLSAGAAMTVYDISDDFVEYYSDEERRSLFAESLAFSCSQADLVLAVNDHVAERYGRHNPHTHVLRNATNFENFVRDTYAPVDLLEQLRAQGRPIIGYTGIINRVRVDYELLEAILALRPGWSFVFVGSADPSFLELVQRHENLHHQPQVNYEVLPDWIAGFDTTMIPFRVNEHTRGNDLLKFNDYLATGRHIVCTDTGGARDYAPWVRIAGSAGEFVTAIEADLAAPRDDDREQRREIAARNSWERRAEDVHALLEAGLAARA